MSMARIPFSEREENILRSAARWMRVVAVFQLVGGAIGLVIVPLVGIMASAVFAFLQTQVSGADKALLNIPSWSIAAVVALVVVSIIATMWASMALLRAADRFTTVANSDDDDSTFLAEGLAALGTFFTVEAVASVVGASGVIFANISHHFFS